MYLEVHLIQGILISFFYLRKPSWKFDRTVFGILLFSIISDFDFGLYYFGIIATRKTVQYAIYAPIILYIALRYTHRYHKMNYKYVTLSYVTHLHSDMVGLYPTYYLYPLLLSFQTIPSEIYLNHFVIQICSGFSIMVLLIWISLNERTRIFLQKIIIVTYVVGLLAAIHFQVTHNVTYFFWASVISLMMFPIVGEKLLQLSNTIHSQVQRDK